MTDPAQRVESVKSMLLKKQRLPFDELELELGVKDGGYFTVKKTTWTILSESPFYLLVLNVRISLGSVGSRMSWEEVLSLEAEAKLPDKKFLLQAGPQLLRTSLLQVNNCQYSLLLVNNCLY